MSWLSDFFKSKEEVAEVAIEASTTEESLERGIFALDGYAEAKGLEESHEKDFYCGICGWVPISQFANHGH